jgi:hypothetical protein
MRAVNNKGATIVRAIFVLLGFASLRFDVGAVFWTAQAASIGRRSARPRLDETVEQVLQFATYRKFRPLGQTFGV